MYAEDVRLAFAKGVRHRELEVYEDEKGELLLLGYVTYEFDDD